MVRPKTLNKKQKCDQSINTSNIKKCFKKN